MTALPYPDVMGRPADVDPATANLLHAQALSNMRHGRWCGTGAAGVPGWVLGELWRDGRIDWRKRDGSAPNMWRRKY